MNQPIDDLQSTAIDRRPAWRTITTRLFQSIDPWLILLIALGVALRLWLIAVTPLDPRFSDADDGDYYRRALRFAVSGQYIDDAWLIRPPLHVFFFAFWLRLALIAGQPQHGVLLIQLAQTAVAALTIGLGYGVARRLFASTRAGLLFAAFLALWFPYVEQPGVLFSELLYLFWFLLHVWLLLRFDASGSYRDLAFSGLALGAAALTRSPALYSLAFVALWLLARAWRETRPERRDPRDETRETRPETRPEHSNLKSQISNLKSQISNLRSLSLVVLCCLAVVGPWTARNYLVYGRFIPVDTLGPINLWLDLDAVSRRNQHIAELRRIPQADRQAYASARVREILAADPLRPFRAMWPTFRHVWKAQYVEDYFVKQSFFARPLREAAPLGLAGDLLWLVFTTGGLIALASPPSEGLHHRLFFAAWLGYSLLTVLVFHVEPRYLLPIWTLIGLYGAWALSSLRFKTPAPGAPIEDANRKERKGLRNSPRFHALGIRAIIPDQRSKIGSWYSRIAPFAQAALVLAFVALFLTYRDYPRIIGAGLARERAMIAAERAYLRGDYTAAEQAFQAALAAQPGFVDAQVGRALALAALGRRDEAAALLEQGGARRAALVAAALRRDSGDATSAQALAHLEATAGEDAQRWAIEWLRPPPVTTLTLGANLDLGYIAGFSPAESDGTRTYRWLEGAGQIALPLSAPLHPQARLALYLAGGRPGVTPLEVRLGDHTWRLPVQGGQWRAYWLPVPAELAGQRRLAIGLRAPTFVPALLDPASADPRALSLMVGGIGVE